MKAQAIADYVFELAPNPEWGTENTWLAGSPDAEVKGIGIAWWLTSEVLEQFASAGINFGICHEPLFFNLPDVFCWGKLPPADALIPNQRLRRVIDQQGITVHRFHSNLDLCDFGMPVALIDQLGWGDYETDWSRGIPVVSLPLRSLGDLIDEVKAKLELPFVRYDGDLDRQVSRVAIPWGGICQWWGGAAAAEPLGYDVVLGGDIIDGVVRYTREQGSCIIDAFHHSTESETLRLLGDKLQTRFPDIPVRFYDCGMPWQVRT